MKNPAANQPQGMGVKVESEAWPSLPNVAVRTCTSGEGAAEVFLQLEACESLGTGHQVLAAAYRDTVSWRSEQQAA